MKRTNEYRKELRTVQESINAWTCLDQALDCVHIVRSPLDSNHAAKLDANISGIHNHYKSNLSAKTDLAKTKELARIVAKQSRKALTLYKEEAYKWIIENSVTKKNSKPNRPGLAYMQTILDDALVFDFSKEPSHRLPNPSSLEERTRGNDDEFEDENILPFLFFANDSSLEPFISSIPKNIKVESIARNSIKSFLMDQNPIYWIDSPLIDGKGYNFNSTLISPTHKEMQFFMHKPALLYTTSIFIPKLVSRQIKENTLLNECSIAKEVSSIIGEIQAHYQYLNTFLNTRKSLQKTGSLVLINRLGSLNTTLNSLEGIAYRLMTSIGKSFEDHINAFLLVFSKVYILFHTTSLLKIPISKLNKAITPGFKDFNSELVHLKTQQIEIFNLLGKMFYSLKTFLTGYFRMQIAKEVNKDFFKLKPDPFGKKDKTLTTFERLYGMLTLAKTVHLDKFFPLCVCLSDILLTVGSTASWRNLVIQQDVGVIEACKKLELILKTNMVAAYVESIVLLFSTQVYRVNFAGIMCFVIYFTEIMNKQNIEVEGKVYKGPYLMYRVPEFQKLREFLMTLVFDDKAKGKNDKASARSRSVDTRSSSGYAWIKKIKSKKFNKPDMLTPDLLLQLIQVGTK